MKDIRGCEPGTKSYVRNSNIAFIRNSCFDYINFDVQNNKALYLNPNHEYSCDKLLDGDIVIATDANIGDSAYFCKDASDSKDYYFSSEMIKISEIMNLSKYYLFAMLRDDYFRLQLDYMTPKGATIRHSGESLLKCNIVMPKASDNWIINIIDSLVKNIIHSEQQSVKNMSCIFNIYKNELNSNIYVFTNLTEINSEIRVDAGIYSEIVKKTFNEIKKYKNGFSTLSKIGFKPKRGPSLQIRDLGRSIQIDEYRSDYYKLIYPSDISDNGYVEKITYLGASGKVWFLEKGDILFSAEGNVGKTFTICDYTMKFTTNIHGIIITPIKEVEIKEAVFVGIFLSYLRHIGVMDKLSVGGQGGSFAVQYWDKLIFPNIPTLTNDSIYSLYFSGKPSDPFTFDKTNINSLGVFEINGFRNICNAILNIIISDIKNDDVKNEDFYRNLSVPKTINENLN